MQSYEDSWKNKLPKKRFDINAFRALTLTTSNDRIQTMVEAYRPELDKMPVGVFLFAVQSVDLVTRRVWINAAGKYADII